MDELDLERWGTRFASSAAERAFAEWQFARTMPQLRVLIGAVLSFWIVMPLTLVLGGVVTWTRFAALGSIVYTAILVGVIGLWRRRLAMWRAYWVFGAPCWALIAGWAAAEYPEIDRGGIVVITGTTAGIVVAACTDGARYGTPCGVVLAAGAQVLRSRSWLCGELSGVGLAYETAMLWACFGVGLIVALNSDRAAHVAYRQERIIESQRERIARAESALQKELSYQVAERSRELGAVLAKSDVTLDVRRLAIGERFAERYKIVAALGAGGMGAVYEVERVTDGAKLALKAVSGEVSGASAARFAREAEIGARVRHSNLISIVDVGVASGVPYLAMELVRGGSLEAQRARFGEVAWALPILRQIAEGLAALHDAGVVHRDLKPANVLLAETGAKISDFGISRFGAIEDAPSIDPGAATMAATPKKSAELTGTGVVMGTPLYMAPEGARSARALDASADVFAFGIIAYEMLTGRAPFAVPAFVLAMAEQPIPIPPAIDDARGTAALRALVLAALSGDPTKRPRVRELTGAL